MYEIYLYSKIKASDYLILNYTLSLWYQSPGKCETCRYVGQSLVNPNNSLYIFPL